MLDRHSKDHSAVARDLCRIAQILQQQGRYTDAERRYDDALTAAHEAGDYEVEGIIWQSLGIIQLHRKRPDEAVPSLRQALDAFARAGDVGGQMQVLNSLGNADKDRGHAEAALAWYERSLELAEQLGNLQGRATARSNLAILLANQAEVTIDPHVKQSLLNHAISEGRESLAIRQQLGHPAEIAIGHNNLAADLLLLAAVKAEAGSPGHELLDEAEHHARAALDIRDRCRILTATRRCSSFPGIAEGRGDNAGAAEWRTCADAAYADAQERAGAPALQADIVLQLAGLALTARQQDIPFADTLASAGADESRGPPKPDRRHGRLAVSASGIARQTRGESAGNPRPGAVQRRPRRGLDRCRLTWGCRMKEKGQPSLCANRKQSSF